MTPEAKRLQALLFVAGEAVPMRELARVLDITSEQLSLLLEELAHESADQGLALVRSESEVELTTSPEVGRWLSETARLEPVELSRAAVETLAVVAYGGPLTRYEIDLIRGVDSRQMIRRLLKQGILRRESLRGRAPQYDITEEFLKSVGAVRREDLPEYQSLAVHPSLTAFLKRSS